MRDDRRPDRHNGRKRGGQSRDETIHQPGRAGHILPNQRIERRRRRQRAACRGHYDTGDPIENLVGPLIVPLELADRHRVELAVDHERQLGAGLAQPVERHGLLRRLRSLEPARPRNIGVVRPHGVDDAVAADQLVDDEVMVAALRDHLRDRIVGKREAAEDKGHGCIPRWPLRCCAGDLYT